jgi:hypothetical protein
MAKKLTREQVTARFPEFAQQWSNFGLSIEPADRAGAEAAIADLYRQAGLPPPRRIVWCGSPLSLVITRAILLNDEIGISAGAGVWDSIWQSIERNCASLMAGISDSVWEDVSDCVDRSFWTSGWHRVDACIKGSAREWRLVSIPARDFKERDAWESIRRDVQDKITRKVEGNIRASVGQSVEDSFWTNDDWQIGYVVPYTRDRDLDSVWDTIWDSVRHSVGDRGLESISASGWDNIIGRLKYSSWAGFGQHGDGDLAFCAFVAEVLGLSDGKMTSGAWALAKTAGFAVPHEHICFVSERHNVLNLNAHGRLHCLTGQAVAYPDRFSIYAVNGVRVPETVITRGEHHR